MTASELREKVRLLIPQVYSKVKKGENDAVEYDELTKFPELKAIITNLLSHEFDNFLASIDWVAPKPTTFRINLKNDQEFYLIYSRNSWIAQVEGKKYYLLNLPEEERATLAIARILRYGPKAGDTEEVEGGSEGIDVEVDDTIDIEA
tara:strand:- start:4 stop:447 length:444 start_codon:yes stop_codon:yes gene_type:complete